MKKLILSIVALSTVLFFSFSSFDSYKVDTAKSKLTWTGYHLAKSYEHNGSITIKSGTVEVVDDKITGGKFTIDMTSLSNSDLSGGKKEKLEKHLKSDDFFAVGEYPEATLVIKSVANNTATADITIRGITEEISFDIVVKEITDTQLVATTTLKIDRTKHKVMYGWSIENAMLSNEFEIKVALIANK